MFSKIKRIKIFAFFDNFDNEKVADAHNFRDRFFHQGIALEECFPTSGRTTPCDEISRNEKYFRTHNLYIFTAFNYTKSFSKTCLCKTLQFLINFTMWIRFAAYQLHGLVCRTGVRRNGGTWNLALELAHGN